MVVGSSSFYKQKKIWIKSAFYALALSLTSLAGSSCVLTAERAGSGCASDANCRLGRVCVDRKCVSLDAGISHNAGADGSHRRGDSGSVYLPDSSVDANHFYDGGQGFDGNYQEADAGQGSDGSMVEENDGGNGGGNCTPHNARVCYGDAIHWQDSCGNLESLIQNCGLDQYCRDAYCWTEDPSCLSHNSKLCHSNDVYWQDSCGNREELFDDCSPTERCQNSLCGPICTTHDHKECYNSIGGLSVDGDAYWFDSCGNLEDLAEDCGLGQYCDSAACVNQPPLCTAHDTKVCHSNDVYWQDSCGNREELFNDCSPTERCQDAQCEPICTTHDHKGCYNSTGGLSVDGDAYWFDSCSNLEDLAEDCSLGQYCSDAACLNQPPQCNTHDIKICYSNDVYWQDSCGNREELFDDCSPAERCRNAQCELICSSHEYKECYNSTGGLSVDGDAYWFDSCGNLEDLAEDCGLGQYCSDAACLNQPPQCTAHDIKICNSNDVYWQDSCGNLEELFLDCSSTEHCENAQCLPNCVTHDHKACQEGNAYWFDSCDAVEDLVETCGLNYVCQSGVCVGPTCLDECDVNGQKSCEGDSWKQCGNYDEDSCREWSTLTSCGTQTCDNGNCVDRRFVDEGNGFIYDNVLAKWWEKTSSSDKYSHGGSTAPTHCLSIGMHMPTLAQLSSLARSVAVNNCFIDPIFTDSCGQYLAAGCSGGGCDYFDFSTNTSGSTSYETLMYVRCIKP